MKKILLLSFALSLSGCSTASFLKSTEPQQTTYSLRSAAPLPDAQTGPARILEIAKPSVPPGFDTDRIALYTEEGHKLDYYSAAKWPDTLDSVLQDFTRRTATNVLPYVVTVTSEQSVQAEYRLQTKVNEFQPVYGSGTSSAPQLDVSVEFTLIKLPQEEIVGSFTLSKTATATSNRLDAITAGLEKMLQEIEGQAFGRLDERLRKSDVSR